MENLSSIFELCCAAVLTLLHCSVNVQLFDVRIVSFLRETSSLDLRPHIVAAFFLAFIPRQAQRASGLAAPVGA